MLEQVALSTPFFSLASSFSFRVLRIPMQCPHQLIAELASDAPHVVGFRSVLVAYGMNTEYGAGTQNHQH